MKAEKVRRFLNLSLKNLQMDYVDLYLIHDPFGVEGKHDYDFYPLDDRGRVILDMNTDLLAIWKVNSRRCLSTSLLCLVSKAANICY